MVCPDSIAETVVVQLATDVAAELVGDTPTRLPLPAPVQVIGVALSLKVTVPVGSEAGAPDVAVTVAV
jgi:hypothetical protein